MTARNDPVGALTLSSTFNVAVTLTLSADASSLYGGLYFS